jgi:hypothetical protein
MLGTSWKTSYEKGGVAILKKLSAFICGLNSRNRLCLDEISAPKIIYFIKKEVTTFIQEGCISE